MKILFIEAGLLPTRGGVERVTYTLGEMLRKNGFDVYYAFYGNDYDKIDKKNKFRFDIKSTDNKLIKSFILFIKENNISLIICQNIHSTRFQKIYIKIKENTGVKIITCLHCNPDIWVNKNKFGCTFFNIYIKELLRSIYFRVIKNPYKVNQKGMYDLSDKYILLSESFKYIFCKLNGVDGKKLQAIPNPCPFTVNLDTEIVKENVVLVVSRMAEQQKRISNVLYIWSTISNKFPDWKLELVGDGPDLNKYTELSQKLRLKNIKFVGNSKNPQKYYKRAKIFMMTSIWEGFGMTLIEAQNYGCVPIAYNSYAAVNDIILNGENGFVIPIHDIEMYANKMTLLMKDLKLWNKMSKTAKLTSSRYDESHILELWQKLFDSLKH